MKITDVTVGGEYGVIKETGRREATAKNARRVKVLEIVTTTEPVSQSYGPKTERKVRKLKVKLLDPPLPRSGYGWGWGVVNGEQGTVFLTDARHLLGPWELVGPDHKAAWANELGKAKTHERVKEEAEKIGLGDVSVTTMSPTNFQVRLTDAQWKQIVAALT